MKFQQQLKRMSYCRKAIDFYNNNQKQYMHKNIEGVYKVGSQLYKKFLRKFPITQRLVDDQSLLFKTPPQITINGTDKQKELFNELLNSSLFNSMISTVNRLVNLTGKVGVIPR